MSNREIDRKIAELLGMDLNGFEWAEGVYRRVWGDVMLKPDDNNSFISRKVPYYSSDWNAMRLLVEWLNDKNVTVCLNIDSSKAAVTLVQDNRLLADVESFPAPLALCEAVLALPTELLGPKGSDATEKAQAEEGSI